MSTIIVFSDHTRRLTVGESLGDVRNRWEAQDGHRGLLHLTNAKTGTPVAVNAERVAYFLESSKDESSREVPTSFASGERPAGVDRGDDPGV